MAEPIITPDMTTGGHGSTRSVSAASSHTNTDPASPNPNGSVDASRPTPRRRPRPLPIVPVSPPVSPPSPSYSPAPAVESATASHPSYSPAAAVDGVTAAHSVQTQQAQTQPDYQDEAIAQALDQGLDPSYIQPPEQHYVPAPAQQHPDQAAPPAQAPPAQAPPAQAPPAQAPPAQAPPAQAPPAQAPPAQAPPTQTPPPTQAPAPPAHTQAPPAQAEQPAIPGPPPAHQNLTSGRISQITPEHVVPLHQSLKHIVENSTSAPSAVDGSGDLAGPTGDAVHSHGTESRAWISHFFPKAETVYSLFAAEHMGNYVIERTTGKKFFETMPLYVRVGMHLLFVSGATRGQGLTPQAEFMSYKRIEQLLEEESIRQGEIYDRTGPDVLPHIQSFIRSYSLPLDELLVQDLTQYPTFNSFFARRLVANARPITAPDDPRVIVSPSDCRLCVFPGVDQAKELWIKGEQFSIDRLLLGDDTKEKNFDAIINEPNVSIAVCRLAPQDYHRFHSPVEAECIYVKNIKGELYTVNPQAINENLNVFTMNKRSIMLMHANLGPGKERTPMAMVAVGALLVGSIAWSKKIGERVSKGEEIGWFQYGGSTIILVFPSSAGIHFDDDLWATSQKHMETLVRVGMEIATVT